MASTAPQDNGGSLRKSIGLIELFTFWTCEPIRPAQAFQIGSAGGIIGKNPLKIGKRCWKAAGVHSGKLSPIHRIGNKPDRQERSFAFACAGLSRTPRPSASNFRLFRVRLGLHAVSSLWRPRRARCYSLPLSRYRPAPQVALGSTAPSRARRGFAQS